MQPEIGYKGRTFIATGAQQIKSQTASQKVQMAFILPTWIWVTGLFSIKNGILILNLFQFHQKLRHWPFVDLRWHFKARTTSRSWDLTKGEILLWLFSVLIGKLLLRCSVHPARHLFLKKKILLVITRKYPVYKLEILLLTNRKYFSIKTGNNLLNKQGWLCWDGVWSVHPARHRKIYHEQLHILAQHWILTGFPKNLTPTLD